MATRHTFGYSRSTRAKCHGPHPCNGTPLEAGTLRYGLTNPGEFGETVEWRHWGCVTPSILNGISTFPIDSISGFKELTHQDQQKVKLAISLRRIDPSDIPVPTQVAQLTTSAGSTGNNSNDRPSQKKRKAEQDTLLATQSSDSSVSPPQSSSSFILHRTIQSGEDEATEEATEEDVRDELYCTMNTNVVGIQYYQGLVGPGEEVMLVREPNNSYDRNAIQVKNISQVQVGHLPRTTVARLAPLLDNRLVTVEGVINDGNLTGRAIYTLSITLRMYGASDARDQLEPRLIWATPGQRGFPSRFSVSTSPRAAGTATTYPVTGSTSITLSGRSDAPTRTGTQQEALRKRQEALDKAAELKQILTNLEKIDDERRRSSLLDTLCSIDDTMNLPNHPNPPGTMNGELKVDLLKHQSQALQWCIEREYPALPKKESDRPVQFWQFRKNGNKSYYYNIATKTPQETAPILGRGALCADAMGLGKTLTMLALILATKKDVPQGFSNSTLIVSPLSVLSNWEKQISDHCAAGSISAYFYYNTNRSLSAEKLAKYDIVITTYQTVTGEYTSDIRDAPIKKKKKTENNLFDIQWKRIILDEGHTIRNPKTKMARAVFGLRAHRRWILTGTPIINSPKDIGSILTFLQICRPLDNEDFYKRLLLRPLKEGNPSGVELLRALMSHICIRRTKEMQDSLGNSLVPLPPVEMITVPVKLTDAARALYDEVEHVSKQRFETFMSNRTHSMVQSNVLSMLTRMRQLALHPGLVPLNYLDELRAMGADDGPVPQIAKLNLGDISRLRGLLARALEDFEECPICFGVLHDARITNCGHMFCHSCIQEVISRDPKCPMDRRPLSTADLFEPPPPTDLTQAPVRMEERCDVTGVRGGSSAKIDQLVQLLQLTPMSEKSLVFSQFTSFLDKIADTLEAEGIPYVRFDGRMSAKKRQEAIARFSIPISEGKDACQLEKISTNDDSSDSFVDNDVENFIDDEGDDSTSSKKNRSKGKGRGLSISSRPEAADSPPSSGDNPKVMLLSLKAGAVGLNLTMANNVYLMDPWWQEGIENQAIDRVNRIGQNKPVHVYQLIAENTVESKVLEIQGRKKKLVQQAFSGINRTETQRQQKEARLQDLIQLFGLRQQDG